MRPAVNRHRLADLMRGYALFGLLLSTGVLLAGCASHDRRVVPPVWTPDQTNQAAAPASRQAAALRVMTLNIAHARGDGFHQLLQGALTAQRNLDRVSDIFEEINPHVIALQEADKPSFWSGDFNHVDYLARQRPLARYTHGIHASGPGLAYGTALISDLPLRDPLAVTFDPRISPTPKGFLVSTIGWPGAPRLQVDIISLHLDPFSASTRAQQASELIATLQGRNHPMVLMGDFNTDWNSANSAVRLIAEALDLKAYRPDAPDMTTFPAFSSRLDWILISPELDFLTYTVIPHPVSDHYGVVASIAPRKQQHSRHLTLKGNGTPMQPILPGGITGAPRSGATP